MEKNLMNEGADMYLEAMEKDLVAKDSQAPWLHTANLSDEKQVEYFLAKAEDIESKYGKTVAYIYTTNDKLVATLPVLNMEDGTDLTSGPSTLRNTINGNIDLYGKVKACIGQAGVNYHYRDNPAQVGTKIDVPANEKMPAAPKTAKK